MSFILPGMLGVVGSPIFTDKYSAALDGTNQYLQISGLDPSVDIGTGNYTINMWVFVETGATESFPYFMAFGDGTDYQAIGLTDKSTDDYDLRIMNRFNATYSQDVIGTRDISAGNWYMLTIRRYSSLLWGLINGVEKLSLSGTNVTSNDFGASSDFRFGYNSGTSADRFLEGRFSQIAFWDTGVSTAGLLELYNSGTPKDPRTNGTSYTQSSNLKGFWSIEENTGTTTSDLTIYANNGTFPNGLTWSATAP